MTIRDTIIEGEKKMKRTAYISLAMLCVVFGFSGGVHERISLADYKNGTNQNVKVNKNDDKEIATSDTKSTTSTTQLSKIQPEKLVVKPEDKHIQVLHTTVATTGDTGLGGIKKIYQKYATKALNENIDWLYKEATKRGLNAKLIFAIQAQESAWGKGTYCIKYGNCLSFGITDSGLVGDYFSGDYKVTMTKILNKMAIKYKMNTAEGMSKEGFNSHQSWINNVNSIIRSFK